MLISITSIPLWLAIAVLACLWGLLVWRMIVMLPGQYLPHTLIGLTACSVVFIIRDRASHFGLESAALSMARVKQRVAQGGHDVPAVKLRARFPRTLRNLRAAIPIVDEAFVFDNSSFDHPYRIIAVYERGQLVSRHPPLPAWTRGLPGL